MSLNGVGTCQVSRQRAGKVTSLGRFAFAVETGSGMPVITTSSKGQILFSEKGAGIYPVVFAGIWNDIAATMAKYQDTQFNIDDGLRAHGFTLHMSAAVAKYGKDVVIHDAMGDAIVNVVSTVAGFGAGGIGDAFGTSLTNTISSIGGGMSDSVGLFRTLFPSKPKTEKHVAVWFHYLPFNNGVNTGKYRTSIGTQFGTAYQLVKAIAT